MTSIYKPRTLYVAFHNRGGISISCPRYAHHYDNAEQAAADFCALAKGADISKWDGNEIKDFDDIQTRATGVYNRNRILDRAYRPIESLITMGSAEEEFYEHVRRYVED